jgi:hypothetical protein
MKLSLIDPVLCLKILEQYMRGLNLGVVVILDALGFKGIWAREDARRVLKHMKSLRREAHKLQGRDRSGVLLSDHGFRHRVRCMSDTIVVTVVVKGPKAPQRALYRAMLSASMIAGNIMFDALYGSPTLLFRGCMAAGEMKEEVDSLIGPAVDEAAERFEKADGPFLWMAPSALDISQRYADTYMDRIEPVIMLPYTVPLNDGSEIKTSTFSYFTLGHDIYEREVERRTETRRHLLEAFGHDPLVPSVRTKKQNTLLLLDHLEGIAKAGSWRKEKLTWRKPDWKDLSLSQKLQLLGHGIRW